MRFRGKKLTAANGFSLIELVVVIAILSILTTIALPSFVNIQKDAKVNQVKTALATFVKECVVASLRGKSLKLRDLPSAKASLPGYILAHSGFNQGTSSYESSECISSLPSGGSGTLLYANPTEYVSGQAYTTLPQFQIVYDANNGTTTRVCQYYYGVSGVYPAGCDAPAPPTCTLPPPGQQCPQPGQGWTVGKW